MSVQYLSATQEHVMAAQLRRLSVSIDRPAGEAYEFLAVAENFPKGASGLGQHCARRARTMLSIPRKGWRQCASPSGTASASSTTV
jgi:hypothetical protein